MLKQNTGCRAVRLALSCWALSLALPAMVSADQVAIAVADPWQWLEHTYWYVPQQNLPALASSADLPAPLPVSDQTVYYISNYAGGYFWGSTAVTYSKIGNGSEHATAGPSCLQLVGSVTPEGRVHLTFSPMSAAPGSQPTIGIGTMVRLGQQWTMENQMSTNVGPVLLTHWAYMHQCRPGLPCFDALPGLGVSIPQFLGPCLP